MESSIADLLLGKIVSILENEVALLSGLRDEINEIKLELTSMRSFLEDADKGGVHGKTEGSWISSVRDMVYEVEDIIDEFMYHVNKQKQLGFFSKAIQCPGTLLLKRKVAVKLQDINKRIKSIAERSQRYGGVNRLGGLGGIPSNSDPNWLRNYSESSLFLKDDDLVGIEKTQKKLLGWLLNGEPRRTFVSVVGMGGLGKTTLVANTFKKQIVKQHFECCAWITVSQQYGISEILKSMVKEVYKNANDHEQTPKNLSSMSYIDLVETLVKMLQTKRYLIVLDDVWHINFWNDIKVALPTNVTGSRILLTTRMEDIASFEFDVVNFVLPLNPLTVKASWNLFCKKAFASKQAQCPPYLDPFARDLVAKCEGLPLAIVALGGLMASKNSIVEWDGICKNLNWELSENDKFERLKYISLLGYHDLPYRLKQCFLYCCIFPEDYLIKRKRLIRLWMAEGFVQPTKESTPEVVAQGYLTELICRGLLQVVTRNESRRPRRCKMHDVLRELALSISKVENFVAISDGKGVEDCGIRRLSIEATEHGIKAGKGIGKLRSLLAFIVDDYISQSSFNRLPPGFKLLTVLDLEDAPIDKLSDELVNLFNLRYLNLTRTKVKELPKSIGKLYNLQSLIAKRTQITELPPGIVKLKNLRYLIIYRYNASCLQFDYAVGIGVPANICSLERLQLLSFVEARGNLIKQLSKMAQLTRLSISKVKEADGENLCVSIGNMRLLRYLLVMSCNEDEMLKMDALEVAPPLLEKLFLAGKLEKLPHWFNSLHSVTNLYLHWSRLREDFLPHIQALPNLGKLTLLNAYDGERLCFIEGFQKLKILMIWKCPHLKEIVINKGVMPGLEELNIDHCQELITLPHGWESELPDLKQVYLGSVSSKIIQQFCAAANRDYQSEIHAIYASRVEVEESKFEWHYKFWYKF
ncbi:Disease resistance protein [Corchorus capsularis]|uniref:Disease resistance protein n=1 Tax=Corchorus capsularis TaxID=210143 RepID=A0A1R3HHN3_COCAP|nr:Disease resistance protein [Corchorus capsularis]